MMNKKLANTSTSVLRRVELFLMSMILTISSLGGLVPVSVYAVTDTIEYTSVDFNSLTWKKYSNAPSGGYTVDASQLQFSIDSKKPKKSRTEGLVASVVDNNVASVKASLYLDTDWSTKPVRVSFQPGFFDETAAVKVWPVIEYTNVLSGFNGWRVYDAINKKWSKLASVDATLGDSYKLEIRYNSATQNYDYYINDDNIASFAAIASGVPCDNVNKIRLHALNSATGDSIDDYSVVWQSLEIGQYTPEAPVDLAFYEGASVTAIADGSVLNSAYGVDDIQLKWATADSTNNYKVEMSYPDGTSQTVSATAQAITIGGGNYFGQKGDGVYKYRVMAQDSNTDLWSEWSDYTQISYDDTKPSTVLNGLDDILNNGDSLTIEATDNIGLDKIIANIYNADTAILAKPTQSSASGNTSYSHLASLSGLVEGNYYVKYNSIDLAGNISATTTFSFTIDNTAPVVNITSPIDGVSIKGSVIIGGNVVDENPDHYYLVVKNSSNKVVAGPGTVYADDVSDFTWNTASVVDGVYTITLAARDAADNKDTSSTEVITVIVDNTAPFITLNGDANVTMLVGDTYSDAGATATDGNDGDISSSIVVTGSVDTNTAGIYTITYDVADSTGNVAASIFRTVTVAKRNVTVVADTKTKDYGAADPEFTYTTSGDDLITGDVFTGSLSRVSGEDSGVYQIQQGDLALDSNYVLTYIPANLTIGTAPAVTTTPVVTAGTSSTTDAETTTPTTEDSDTNNTDGEVKGDSSNSDIHTAASDKKDGEVLAAETQKNAFIESFTQLTFGIYNWVWILLLSFFVGGWFWFIIAKRRKDDEEDSGDLPNRRR